MKMKRITLTTLLLGLGLWLMAQPETDIYLLELDVPLDSTWTAGPPPRNLTPRQGYDNQPHFTPDGRYLLFVSMDDQQQTDVFRHDLQRNATERLTNTRRRSEYSPTVVPSGEGFSAIVVEEDGTQRLWYFAWGDDRGEVLMDKLTNVGYHVWYHPKRLGMFVLGEPPTLEVAHRRWQRPKVLADSIGRCLQPIPGAERAFSYVDKSQESWRIMRWDARSKQAVEVAPCLPGSEDYAWTAAGRLLMAQGGTLYQFDPASDQGWQVLVNPGLGRITRLAISPDRRYLALVVEN